MAARKKKIIRRARSGLAAVQVDKGFDHVLYAFHYEMDKKTLASICKDYVKKTYSKPEYLNIFAH